MVADSERVGDNGQRRVYRGARYEKAAVDDIEIVDPMGAAIHVESRAIRVTAETDGAVLVTRAGDWQPLAEIGVLREQMRLAADVFEQMPQLFGENLMRPEVVRRVMKTNSALGVEQDPVLGVRQVLARQPKIERVAGELARRKAREQAMALAAEHRRIGLAEHLDVPEREILVLEPK